MINDLSHATYCTELKNLDISENSLEDISTVSALIKLELLNFSHNNVIELPEFEKNCALITIDGSHNKILSLDKLSGLENLNNVFMDYNEELASIEPLIQCPRIVQVKVYGTSVAEVTALLEMNVIVEFDPTLRMENN